MRSTNSKLQPSNQFQVDKSLAPHLFLFQKLNIYHKKKSVMILVFFSYTLPPSSSTLYYIYLHTHSHSLSYSLSCVSSSHHFLWLDSLFPSFPFTCSLSDYCLLYTSLPAVSVLSGACSLLTTILPRLCFIQSPANQTGVVHGLAFPCSLQNHPV